MKKIVVILFNLIIILTYSYPDEINEPAWIILKKGEAEFRNKEYGNALHYLKLATSVKENYPEAEILIGDIYRLSDNPIAKEYYKMAYKNKNYFEIPEEKYIALYRLVETYKTEKEYSEYVKFLYKILGEDGKYINNQFKRFEDAFMRVFSTKGLNRLLLLYRIHDLQYVVNAHKELGWYYYKTGIYKSSIIHNLFSCVHIISEAFREVRNIKPLYQFESLEVFLHDALYYDNINKYLMDEAQIYKVLYYLGCAVYVELGYPKAKKIWEVIIHSPVFNDYKKRAEIQIRSPWVEDLINIKKDFDFEWDL